MLKLKTPIACLMISALSITSTFAQNAIDNLSYVPSNAQNIYVFNIPSIIKKADIEAIKKLSFLQEVLSKSESSHNEFSDVVRNPKESGLSFSAPYIMSISPMEDLKFNLMSFIIPIEDVSKFSALMKKSPLKISENGGVNIAKNDSNAIAWNNNVVIFSTFKKSKESLPSSFNTEGDSTSADTTALTLPELHPEQYFVKKAVKNPKIDTVAILMRTPHDIYYYQNTDGSSKSPKAIMASMLFNLNPDDLNGNITSGWADFENGRIYGETQQRMNAVMQEKFGSLFMKKPSVDWNNYINNGSTIKPILTISLSLNPQGLKKLIDDSPMMKKGVDKMAQKTDKKGSLEDIIKALNGDIFATAGMGEKELEYLIGISIKNKDAARKILLEQLKCTEIVPNLFKMADKAPVEPDSTVQTLELKPDDEKDIAPKPKSSKPKPYILLKDDVILLGNQASLDKIASPTFRGSVATTEWQKNIQNKPFYINIDMMSLMNIGGAAAAEKLGDLPIESMSMTSGNNMSTFELKMMDKNANSLFSLIQTIDTIVQKKAEQKRQIEEMMKQEENMSKKKRDSTMPDYEDDDN